MFDPELIIYNAGTDILDGDPLGGLKVKPQIKLLSIIFLSDLGSVDNLWMGNYHNTMMSEKFVLNFK